MKSLLLSVFLLFVTAMPQVSATEPAVVVATNAPRIRLAIAGFAPSEPSREKNQKDTLRDDLLLIRLSQSEKFQLVERQELDAALRELALTQTQIWTPGESVRLGKLLRADWLLLRSRFDDAGTNTTIVKVVDARTGVILDLTAIPMPGVSLEEEAATVAAFAELATIRVAHKEQLVFFGIGGFEDLGVNHRHPELRAGLRAHLEQTFRGTRFSVVERAMVKPLLTELRLNLGGLTEEVAGEPSAQPAFLLMDGNYQSLQEDRALVDLILRLQEVGGRERLYSLKVPPGRELNNKIAVILTTALRDLEAKQSSPERKAEADVQLARGMERARIQTAGDNYYQLGGYAPTPAGPDQIKRGQNIREAMEAFEAVLLLTPDNAKAKTYLAICLLDSQIGKKEAGREYLKEVITAATDMATTVLARRQLARSYQNEDGRQALAILLALARDVTWWDERMLVQEEVLQVAQQLRETGQLPIAESIKLVEAYFLTYCQYLKQPDLQRRLGFYPFELAPKFDLLEWVCQFQHEAAKAHWEQFLPKVVEQNPDLAPHLWASYVLWQTAHIDGQSDAVPPLLVARLTAALEFCWAQPAKIAFSDRFAIGFAVPLLEWSVCHRQYGLGETVFALFDRSAARLPAEEQLKKGPEAARLFYYAGYCKKMLGKWPQALDDFETFKILADILIMEKAGPWGKAGVQVRAADLVAECRVQLGMGKPNAGPVALAGAARIPAKFSLGSPVLTVGQPMVFACDGDQIWLTDGFAPFVYNQRDQTLTDLDWPTNIEHVVTCIRVGKDTVWWGTLGSGLVAMDKQTRRCKVYHEADGLLLSAVTTLALDQDKLWIGCGMGNRGGLCYLDLNTGRFTALTTTLRLGSITNRFAPNMFSYTNAPGSKILALATTPKDGLWVLGDELGLRNYSEAQREWKAFHTRQIYDNTCLAASTNFIAIGGMSQENGVLLHALATRQLKEVRLGDWVKPAGSDRPEPDRIFISSLAVCDNKLWVGGMGFLALVDLEALQLEKFCVFDPRWALAVQGLEIAGHDLWVAIGNKLYRLPKLGPI